MTCFRKAAINVVDLHLNHRIVHGGLCEESIVFFRHMDELFFVDRSYAFQPDGLEGRFCQRKSLLLQNEVKQKLEDSMLNDLLALKLVFADTMAVYRRLEAAKQCDVGCVYREDTLRVESVAGYH